MLDPNNYHPKYWHTRKVSVGKPRSGMATLSCDCGMQQRLGTICRHIYCILARAPTAEDCSPKHLKAFQAFYGVNKEFTKKCDALNMTWRHGIAVTLPIEEEYGRESFDKRWFLESLDKIVERNPTRQNEESESGDDGFDFSCTNNDSDGEASTNTEHKESSGDAELEEWKRDPFAKFMPMYKVVMQQIKTTDDVKKVQEQFNIMHQIVLAGKPKEKGNNKGVASLPNTETRTKAPRKRARGEV